MTATSKGTFAISCASTSGRMTRAIKTLDGFRRIITDYLETLTDDEVLITVSVAILEASATAYESYRIDWNDTCAYIDKVVDALFKNDNN